MKGLTAGLVNLCLALLLDAYFPSTLHLLGAMLLGLFAYGVSLAVFVVSLRHLGSARTGAYFSVAPLLWGNVCFVRRRPGDLVVIVGRGFNGRRRVAPSYRASFSRP